jgi:hypothetical protein
MLAAPRPHPLDQLVFPPSMQAGRHQIIHQIIAGGDVREDAADPPRLFLRLDVFVAKRNLVHRRRL